LIDKAASDILLDGETVLTKYIAEFKEQHSENIGHNILGIYWTIKKDLGNMPFKCITLNTEYTLEWSGYGGRDKVISSENW